MLVEKLERVGIRGVALSIFGSFLSDRVQRVKIDKFVSSDAVVKFGVPQGSILGPSLFLIYVNDLCSMNFKNGKIISYADDTALVFSGDTWNDVRLHAEEGLLKINRWLTQNLLTLNVSKTAFLQFSLPGAKPSGLNIKVHSCGTVNNECSCLTLSQSGTMKYLGVVLDEKMSWYSHIELVSTRTRKLIWIFKNLRHVADFELIKRIYFALGQSVIAYCIGVWGAACKTRMLCLERAQRSLLKTMTFRPFRFPTAELYKSCQVLSVRQLYVLGL